MVLRVSMIMSAVGAAHLGTGALATTAANSTATTDAAEKGQQLGTDALGTGGVLALAETYLPVIAIILFGIIIGIICWFVFKRRAEHALSSRIEQLETQIQNLEYDLKSQPINGPVSAMIYDPTPLPLNAASIGLDPIPSEVPLSTPTPPPHFAGLAVTVAARIDDTTTRLDRLR